MAAALRLILVVLFWNSSVFGGIKVAVKYRPSYGANYVKFFTGVVYTLESFIIITVTDYMFFFMWA